VDPISSVATLRETGTAERAGERVARRLAEVSALFGEDMVWVEEELRRSAREGLAPATNSAAHLLESGGKRVRPLALLLSAACFGPIPAAARELAVVAELVHAATLLHDDVIDDGEERRGRPTSRRLWGNAVSVLAGDLLLTHALERTAKVAPGEVLADLFATLRALVDGEVVQLRGRARIDASETVYFEIVRGKTASLFAWAARSGAILAGAPRAQADALARFGSHLGVAFQLVDDVLDYQGDPKVTGKALFGDLAEGKLTLPLIRAIAKKAATEEDLAAARGGDRVAAQRLASAVVASGACAEVRTLALDETAAAVAALDAVPEGVARDLLAAVAGDLAQRLA
jgi:octaprenyl-diphosphate synthase